MATVLLTWTTAPVSVPSNTNLTQYRASIEGVGSTFVAFDAALNAQFNDVALGTYTAQVALSNVDGSNLEFVKSVEFVVPQTTVELQAPDVITVEIS
jgi:hypothetical protein